MTIAVNFLPFGKNVGGAGRYAANMLRAMSTASPGDRFVVVRGTASGSLLEPRAENVVDVVVPSADRGVVRRIWAEQRALPAILRTAGADVLFAPSVSMPARSRVPVVTTIHDIAYVRRPEKYPLLRRTYVRTMTAVAARRSASVLTVSEFSKRELQRQFGLTSERVSVTYNALDPKITAPMSENEATDMRASMGVDGPYLLFVGAIEPSKNIGVVTAALQRLHDEGLPLRLVVTGTLGWSRSRAMGRSSDGLVTIVRPNDDTSLSALYRGARIVVHPSPYEGFGLPVLEAMSLGVPVIAAPAEAVREIAGDAVSWAPSTDAAAWAAAIRRLWSDGTDRSELVRRGKHRAGQFRWDTSASVALDALRSAVRRSGGDDQ